MSWKNAEKILIPAEIIRDAFIPVYNENADVRIDLWNRSMIGLDIMLHNRGGTALIVSVNSQIVASVPAGASFEWFEQKMGLIDVNGTGVFLYDLIVTGVSLDKLKRLKVL